MADAVGLHLDDWQRWVVEGALAERVPGQWAAFEVGLLCPRQNGKGAILEAVELAGLFLTGERLIVHSAHLFSTAREHFLRMQYLVDGSDWLRKQVKRIHTGAGREAIELRNGCRLKFLARTRGAARGFSGDRVILDEAFNLPQQAVGAMLPALSARPNPQIWYVSSAPHADSEVLHGVRKRGHEGSADRMWFAEWGCEPGVDPEGREAWAAANPSLGIRISEEFVENELEALRELGTEFIRERLGVPDSPDSGAQVFGPGVWMACQDEQSRPAGGPVRWALDVHPDLEWASFAACSARADGLTDLAILDRRRGAAWVVEYAQGLHERFGTPVHLDPRSQAGGLISDLRAAGVEVVEVNTLGYTQACARLQRAVHDGTVRHRGQGPLDSAVAGAAVRTVGEAWAWARLSSQVDISPLVAVTLAYGADAAPPIDAAANVW